MKYLLDTCIVSETRKKNPDSGVIRCLSNIEAETLFISVITVGEIASGIKKLGSSRKAKALARWLGELLSIRDVITTYCGNCAFALYRLVAGIGALRTQELGFGTHGHVDIDALILRVELRAFSESWLFKAESPRHHLGKMI